MRILVMVVVVLMVVPTCVVPPVWAAQPLAYVTLYMEGEVPINDALASYRVMLESDKTVCGISGKDLESFFNEILGPEDVGDVYVGWDRLVPTAFDQENDHLVFFTARKAVRAKVSFWRREHLGCIAACEGVLVGVVYYPHLECGCASGALTFCQ